MAALHYLYFLGTKEVNSMLSSEYETDPECILQNVGGLWLTLTSVGAVSIQQFPEGIQHLAMLGNGFGLWNYDCHCLFSVHSFLPPDSVMVLYYKIQKILSCFNGKLLAVFKRYSRSESRCLGGYIQTHKTTGLCSEEFISNQRQWATGGNSKQ